MSDTITITTQPDWRAPSAVPMGTQHEPVGEAGVSCPVIDCETCQPDRVLYRHAAPTVACNVAGCSGCPTRPPGA